LSSRAKSRDPQTLPSRAQRAKSRNPSFLPRTCQPDRTATKAPNARDVRVMGWGAK
jgi:hypothetical protein